MVRMSVAYLSAEVGFESGLHTYSGGLGVLAGDHIKSAADAGLDFVGCTLLYREGSVSYTHLTLPTILRV